MSTPLEDSSDLITRNTLLTAYEDGGVYSLLWWLDTHFPEADVAAKYQAAFCSLRELLLGGYVTLVYASHPEDGPEVPISTATALVVLSRSSAWYPSDPAQGHSTLELRLTQAGVARLRTTPTSDLMDGITRVKGRPA